MNKLIRHLLIVAATLVFFASPQGAFAAFVSVSSPVPGATYPTSQEITVSGTFTGEGPVGHSFSYILDCPTNLTAQQCIDSFTRISVGSTGSAEQPYSFSIGPLSAGSHNIRLISSTPPSLSGVQTIQVRVISPLSFKIGGPVPTTSSSATAPAGSGVTSGPAAPVITNFSVTPSPLYYGKAATLNWSTTNAGGCDLKAYRGLTTAYSIGYKFGVPLARQGASGTITTAAITKENTEYDIYKVSDVLFQVFCFSPDGENYAYKHIVMSLQSESAPAVSLSAPVVQESVVTLIPSPTATLSVSPTGTVAYNDPVTLSWSSTNAVSCAASGDWSAARPTSGSEKTPNLVSGKTYTLTCVNAAGVASAPSTVSVAVAPKPPIPEVSFSAASGNIAYNAATTLTWSSSDATACTASEAWSGVKPVSGTFNTGNLKESKTYTLTCTGPGGQAGTSVNIAVAAAPAPAPVVVSPPASQSAEAPTVVSPPPPPPPPPLPPPPPPPMLTFSVEPSAVAYNGSATLMWSAANATECRSSGGDWQSVSKSVQGSESLSGLVSSKTYMLTCSGPGGEDTRSVAVSVAAPPPPPPAAPTPSPVPPSPVPQPPVSASLPAQDPAPSLLTTLINRLTGNVPASVPAQAPAVPAVVELPPPPTVAIQTIPAQEVRPLSPSLTFSVEPPKLEFNKSVTLSWRAQHAASCVARGDWSGTRPTEGTFTTPPLTASRNYILVCAGPGGSVSSFINLNFESSPQPTISFTANPRLITYGKPISLSWSSTNSQACAASGDWSGTKPVSGSFETSPITSARQYILTCSGPGGYIAHSIRIGAPSAAAIKAGSSVAAPASSSVKPPTLQPAPASTSSRTSAPTDTVPALSLSYTTKTLGGVRNVYLTWSGRNVRSCAASGGWYGSRPTSGTENVGKFKAGTLYRLTCTGATTVTRSVNL